MQAINFVVRTGAGVVERGHVAVDAIVTKVAVPQGSEISLNLRQIDIQSYARVGDSLEVLLVDGRVVLLEQYYAGSQPAARLFISADGFLNEVVLVDGGADTLMAQYGPTEQWGKWSPSDALIFAQDSPVLIAPYGENENEVSMLGAGLLAAGGGVGLMGGGAAALGGAALIGGVVEPTSQAPAPAPAPVPAPIVPTVDTLAPVVIGGDPAAPGGPSFVVAGTGAPGSTVTVEAGGSSQTTVVGAGGTWQVEFGGGSLPGDGSHQVGVVVDGPDGAQYLLDGPTVAIDTTAPEITLGDGAASTGDSTNAADHANGIEVAGTGEPGSSLRLVVEGETYETTVGGDGNWQIVIDPSVLPGGEYSVDIRIETEDSFGNTRSYTDQIVIDTETSVSVGGGLGGADGVFNGAELANGMRLTGTAQPGASVQLTIGTQSWDAVVASDGSWHADIPVAGLADGAHRVDITATDMAGNRASTSTTVTLDSSTQLGFSTATVGGDGTVNATELAGGVRLQGTAEPGATVVVQVAGQSYQANTDGAGQWWLDLGRAGLPDGPLQVQVSATDMAGNSQSTSAVLVVDSVVENFAILSQAGGADGIINAAEAAGGLALNGTVERGAQLQLRFNGQPYPVTVFDDGTWQAMLPAAALSGNGEAYALQLTATDAAGNVRTLDQMLRIDTQAGSLALDPQPIEGDNVINYDEHLDGVVIRGTADPFATVDVSIGDLTHSTQADRFGNWQQPFGAAEIPADTTSTQITARTVDQAGNARQVSREIGIDTVVRDFQFDLGTVTQSGDTLLSGTERDGGLALGGTVETGGRVEIIVGGVLRPAVVQPDGSWTVQFAPGDLPQGEGRVQMIVRAIDRFNNVSETSSWLDYDTYVNRLDLQQTPVAGDNVINIAEAAQGVALNGQVEPGSAVLITVGGMVYEAVVTPDGHWSLLLPPEAIPAGQDSLTVQITAIDAAQNEATISQTFALDLVAPEAPHVDSYTRTLAGYSRIDVDLGADDVTVYEVNHGQPGAQVGGAGVDLAPLGVETFSFTPAIADGSHLIVQGRDAAGNLSSTYLVLDEAATSSVDLSHPGLGAFNIENIDLQFAEDSQLSLTEAQIVALSGNTNSLIVTGGIDDTLTIQGAVRTGQTVQINGQDHAVYALGSEASVMVDEDIRVIL